nr:hypothetical protein [Pseudomonadota bacterium]
FLALLGGFCEKRKGGQAFADYFGVKLPLFYRNFTAIIAKSALWCENGLADLYLYQYEGRKYINP